MCSVMIRPRATSAATTGGTQPGSMSESNVVTAISWANTSGTAFAHIGPRSVSKLTVSARAHDRTTTGSLRRLMPTADSRSSTHAVSSERAPSFVDPALAPVIARSSDTVQL